MDNPTRTNAHTCSNSNSNVNRLSPRLNINMAVHNASPSTRSLQRRLSPRLHTSCPIKPKPADSSPVPQTLSPNSPIRSPILIDSSSDSSAHSAEASSLQRRLSPRLHKPCPSKPKTVDSSSVQQPSQGNTTPIMIGSSSESSAQPTFRPNLGEISQLNAPITSPQKCSHSPTKTPKLHSTDPYFQRRVSPRLHGNLAAKTQKEASDDTGISIGMNLQLEASSVNQFTRRLSPRLHQNPENEGQGNTSMESGIQRRLSPRLHSDAEKEKQKSVTNLPTSGKRLYAELHPNKGLPSAKKSKHNHPKDDGCEMNFERSHPNGTTSTANGESLGELTMRSKVLDNKAKGDGDAALGVAGKSIHARVKETLRIFNTYYRQFIQEEEVRRKKKEVEGEKKSKASKSKQEEVKRTSSRPDLKALSKMRENKEILYPEKKIGHLPGIDVGYQFFSRAEMAAIGFHSHWLNGIDYIGQKGKRGEYRHYTFPIAIAIVMSGQYEDDLDNSDDIVYTGQGGNDLLGNKLQHADQALVRGNLAMKNGMEQSVPVRVIRGHKSANSYSGKIYTYDGLYKFVNTWVDKGQRGHLVYKYRLKRLEGQPVLTTNQVQFVRDCSLKTVSELPGLICRDISNGQEDICIPVTNLFDDATVGSEGFTYIKTLEIAESVNVPPNADGCACKGSCTNPNTCACAKLNGDDFPYVRRDGGRLVEAKDVVFECGPNCGCGPGCLNRISQRNIRYHLEVYRTPNKGWAVRSWDFIPSGAPVCEYIGQLRRTDEVDNISGNDYIFEIDCWHTINEVEGRERRYGNVPVSATNNLPKIDEKTSEPEFCIDAASRGNVARFINHSCEPNLFVQCIVSSHHDLRLARVVLFAADNIPPMQELTYDYGYALDSVIGPDGNVKVLPCFCGTSDCRKRLY